MTARPTTAPTTARRDNPCGDPPGTAWTGLTAPTAQGGALRSQSFRRPAGQPVALNGAILRLDPDTGEAAPGNPARREPRPATGSRIVAYGFRNPFRFTFRPGTRELWAGDVGWNSYEEINRIPDLGRVRNYGWPCYEGPERNATYDAAEPRQLRARSTRRARARSSSRTSPTARATQVVAGRDVPDRSRRRSPACTSTRATSSRRRTRARCSSPTTRASASGSRPRARTGCRTCRTLKTFASHADGPGWLTAGPGRRALVRGRLRRQRAPDRGLQPGPGRADHRLPVGRRAAARRGVRRHRLVRSRGRGDHVRVGPRRRRRVRRLDRRRRRRWTYTQRGRRDRAPEGDRRRRPARAS